MMFYVVTVMKDGSGTQKSFDTLRAAYVEYDTLLNTLTVVKASLWITGLHEPIAMFDRNAATNNTVN